MFQKKKFYPKKNVSGQKQRCIQNLAISKETQQSSKFTQQQSIFLKKAKLREYMTVRGKPTCVRGYSSQNRVYTRLRVKNSHIGRKMYKNEGK